MSNYKKLRDKLEELFQLDQADLDFGIYRIMNSKRDEILNFLDNDLLPQVKSVLATAQGDIGMAKGEELATLETQIRAAGMNPDDSPKVRELRANYMGGGDMGALEQEVFNHLYSFFRRYYDEGDFLSLRRYKEGVYAIPYEGEEVKLHWANADQYYIKTAEHFRDYVFKIGDSRVHLRLVEGNTETETNKEKEKRVFQLVDNEPTVLEDGELNIRFEYRVDSGGRNQSELIKIAFDNVLDSVDAIWQARLCTLAPTAKDPARTILTKHLTEFTSRNTFDYFIHKKLAVFLSLELDFYIKNEVMHLDDIENEAAQKVEQYLAKAKAIRRVGKKIISFLAQLEEFQKGLWLKKKFVLEAQYLATVSEIPEGLLQEVAENVRQREEWVAMFGIDKIMGDLLASAYSEPLTLEFLHENSHLPVDTAFFESTFKQRLQKSWSNIDEACDGLMVHGESYQALRLLLGRYRHKASCAYIDPPYNTGGDDFLYKDNYQESSWLSLLDDRIEIGRKFIKPGGTFAASIDLKELNKLTCLLDAHLGSESRKSNITVKRGSVTGAKVINPGPVNISEYVLMYSIPGEKWVARKAYREKGYDSRYGSYLLNPETSHEEWKFSTVLDAWAQSLGIQKSKLKKHFEDGYELALLDFVISKCEHVVRFASLSDASISKEALSLKKLSRENPGKVFHLERSDVNDYFVLDGGVILFYKDRLIQVGDRMIPGELVSDIWDDVLPNDLHNEGGVELRKGKKPERLIHRILQGSCQPDDLVIDFFAGTATSGAVAQKSGMKWINIEQAKYFDSKCLVRIKKTLYGEQSGVSKDLNWQGGGVVKYIRLEGYEDALANIQFSERTPSQSQLIQGDSKVRDDYMLKYLLESETNGSQSKLNVSNFGHPFEYKIEVAGKFVGERNEVAVDLVETFNLLLGIRVQTMDVIRGFHIVTGRLPGPGNSEKGDRALIIWRDTTENPNGKLDEFCQKWDIRPLDGEFDVIYVNGDNNLQNLRKDEQTWKVRLIEEEFHRLMWDVEDV